MSRRLADKLARLVYRQFATSSLVGPRLRRVPSPSFLPRLHIHALSYSSESIPRSAARTFRVPIAIIIVGAGGIYYVNYQLERMYVHSTLYLPPTNPVPELRRRAASWVITVQGAVTGLVNAASNGIKSVPARVPTVKLPDGTPQILKDLFSGRVPPVKLPDETPQFLKDLFSGRVPAVKLPDETPQFLKDIFSGHVPAVKLSDIKTPQVLKDIFSGRIPAAKPPAIETPKVLKDILSGRVPPVKLPHIETPQFLKDLFTSDESAHHDRGSSSQDSKSDKIGSKR